MLHHDNLGPSAQVFRNCSSHHHHRLVHHRSHQNRLLVHLRIHRHFLPDVHQGIQQLGDPPPDNCSKSLAHDHLQIRLVRHLCRRPPGGILGQCDRVHRNCSTPYRPFPLLYLYYFSNEVFFFQSTRSLSSSETL